MCCDFTENRSPSPKPGPSASADTTSEFAKAGASGGDKVTFGETEVIQSNDEAAAEAAGAPVDTDGSAQAGAGNDQASAAPHLNLPAVLWDRQPGSKNKVPPPVPPRSPRKPMEASPAFEAALNREAAAAAVAGGQRPGSAAAGAVEAAAQAPGPSRGWKAAPDFVARRLVFWLTLAFILGFSIFSSQIICPSYDLVIKHLHCNDEIPHTTLFTI